MIRGGIVEIVGGASSGRTSLLTSWLRDVTGQGAMAALVDTEHAFDPRSAARAGVDLACLLWVRCRGRPAVALRATDLLVRCPGFALIGLDLGEAPPRLSVTAAFRLKLAVRRTGAALAIVAGRRIAGPGACLALETARRTLEWSGPRPAPTRLARVATDVRIVRRRGGLAAAAAAALRWWSA